MIIIGLDPGLAKTGFSVLNTTQPSPLIRCGTLTTPAYQSAEDRLLTLGQDLTKLITNTRPDQAVVEQIFFGNNAKTAIITAQARGVLLYILRQHHVTINTVTPLQLKRHLTGYGQATKQQIQSTIKQRLRLAETPPDDAADAVAAALYLVDRRPNQVSMGPQ